MNFITERDADCAITEELAHNGFLNIYEKQRANFKRASL